MQNSQTFLVAHIPGFLCTGLPIYLHFLPVHKCLTRFIQQLSSVVFFPQKIMLDFHLNMNCHFTAPEQKEKWYVTFLNTWSWKRERARVILRPNNVTLKLKHHHNCAKLSITLYACCIYLLLPHFHGN